MKKTEQAERRKLAAFSFVIRHSSFVIRHSSFVIRHSSFGFFLRHVRRPLFHP
jgi:hypothetical protein